MKSKLYTSMLVLWFLSYLAGCKSVNPSAALTEASKVQNIETALGPVYVKPITAELVEILPHLDAYRGHIVMGNAKVQLVFVGVEGASSKVYDLKVMKLFKFNQQSWQTLPFEGLKLKVNNAPVLAVKDILFSLAGTDEATLKAQFLTGKRSYDFFLSLDKDAGFFKASIQSTGSRQKDFQLSLEVPAEQVDIVQPASLQGEAGDFLTLTNDLNQVGIVFVKPFQVKSVESTRIVVMRDKASKHEFLLFLDDAEQQWAASAALKNHLNYGVLKLKCEGCDIPIALYVHTVNKELLHKIIVDPTLQQNFILPVGQYLLSEDRAGNKTVPNGKVAIFQDQEFALEVAKKDTSEVTVEINGEVDPGSVARLEVFPVNVTKQPPYVVTNDADSVVSGNKIFTKKKKLKFAVTKDRYMARLISLWHGKLCDFEIVTNSPKVSHQCKTQGSEQPPPKWIDPSRHFSRLAFTENRYQWPVFVYPVSRQTKAVWENIYSERRKSLRVSELRDFLAMRKSKSLVALGCPSHGRTLEEYETAVRALRPDAVEIYGCNLRYESELYIKKLTEVMNDLNKRVVFMVRKPLKPQKLPPKIAIFDSAVPVTAKPQDWASTMKEGQYSLVWGTQLQVVKQGRKTQLELRNLSGASPKKLIFFSNLGQKKEVKLTQQKPGKWVYKNIPKFQRSKWWRAEVWGNWQPTGASGSSQPGGEDIEMQLLGLTNFQRNF